MKYSVKWEKKLRVHSNGNIENSAPKGNIVKCGKTTEGPNSQ